MRALVVVAGTFPALRELTPRSPAPLVQCVDRPVLQHVVEYLVERGVSTFDFVLHESAREIEKFLGDGARWGSRFTFHLVCDPNYPYEPLKLLPDNGEAILLVHADRLPLLPDRSVLEQQSTPDVLFYQLTAIDPSSHLPEWSGSALLQTKVIPFLPDNSTSELLEQHLRKFAGETAIAAIELLDFRRLEMLLEAQRWILDNSRGTTHLAAREVDPGIWIARNVTIHPTAQLTAPLFIGENSRIGAGARIGPNAVVGHGSIIDQRTEVIDSAVMPGSYCGEHLELDHVMVDRNRLLNGRLGTAVNVSDTFILSGLRSQEHQHSVRSIVSRALAAVLFLITLPVVLLTGMVLLVVRRKSPMYRKLVAQIPVADENAPLQTFSLYSFRNLSEGEPFSKLRWILLDFLPALGQVAAGKLHMIGVRPRMPDEIRTMPEDWRTLYLQSRAGLLTEAFVIHGPLATEDEVYSCEAYYTAVNGWGHDLSLAVRFVTGPA